MQAVRKWPTSVLDRHLELGSTRSVLFFSFLFHFLLHLDPETLNTAFRLATILHVENRRPFAGPSADVFKTDCINCPINSLFFFFLFFFFFPSHFYRPCDLAVVDCASCSWFETESHHTTCSLWSSAASLERVGNENQGYFPGFVILTTVLLWATFKVGITLCVLPPTTCAVDVHFFLVRQQRRSSLSKHPCPAHSPQCWWPLLWIDSDMPLFQLREEFQADASLKSGGVVASTGWAPFEQRRRWLSRWDRSLLWGNEDMLITTVDRVAVNWRDVWAHVPSFGMNWQPSPSTGLTLKGVCPFVCTLFSRSALGLPTLFWTGLCSVDWLNAVASESAKLCPASFSLVNLELSVFALLPTLLSCASALFVF